MDGHVERVLFVHAHPGDETLATGATIATLTRAGAEVTVLTCTRGELAEAIPTDGEAIPAELTRLSGSRLGEHRVTELDEALAALGVGGHLLLGESGARWSDREPRRYRDSGRQGEPLGAPDPADRESLTAADVGEVAADIAAVVMRVRPDVVVSYAPDGGNGHPDHIRVHEATRNATEVLRVPFYLIDGRPAPRGGVVGSRVSGGQVLRSRVLLSRVVGSRVSGGQVSGGRVSVDPLPVLDAKRRALAAHATRVTLDGDWFSLSSGEPRPVAAIESFTRLRPADDLHRSPVARITAIVLAAMIGFFVGAILTAAHQATVEVGPLVVPWGIVAAVLITAALLVGLRIVFPTRWVAAAAAAGILGASALLSLGSGGGSILVPDNLTGYVWTFAPVLIAALVLGWPRAVRPARRSTQGPHGNIGIPAAKGPDPQ